MINQGKTVHLLFKPKKAKNLVIKEKLMLDGTEVKRVKNSRFLGIWFDDALKFDKQFQVISKKLEDAVKALICVRDSLNFRAKLMVYNGLFKAHIDYCAIAYFDKLKKVQIDELQKLQKNAVRLIFSAKRNVHCGKLFQIAKIRPIDKIYNHEAIILVHKNHNPLTKDKQPTPIANLLNKNNNNQRSLRMYDDEAKIKIDNQLQKGQCFFNIIDAWNNSDQETKLAGNLSQLKNGMNEKMFNEMEVCNKKPCFT